MRQEIPNYPIKLCDEHSYLKNLPKYRGSKDCDVIGCRNEAEKLVKKEYDWVDELFKS